MRSILAAIVAASLLSAPLLFSHAALADVTEPRGAADVTVEYEQAILYSIDDDGILEFNVVHSADVSVAQIIDKTKSGLDSLSALRAALGRPDSPEPVLGTAVGTRTLGSAVTADLLLDRNGSAVSLTITAVCERPVVGISWKRDDIGDDYKGFAEALERNGAFAVFLPQVSDATEAADVLAKLNGVMETGGEDWNPALFGEVQTPHGSAGWNNARDTSDINIMQQAIALDVPLLALCRGEQGLNVAMGGGLIQDVPYYLGQQVTAGRIAASRVSAQLEDNGYRQWDEATQQYVQVVSSDCDHYRVQVDGLIHSGGTGYHALKASAVSGIDRNSKWLYDIIGSSSLEWIATAHHQAVNPEKLGKGLTIVAYSSDGIVEAIEHQSSLFALGVQWHPERDALRDTRGVDVNQDECNAIIGALVRYAGVHADRGNQASSSSSGCNVLGVPALLMALGLSVLAKGSKRRSPAKD